MGVDEFFITVDQSRKQSHWSTLLVIVTYSKCLDTTVLI